MYQSGNHRPANRSSLNSPLKRSGSQTSLVSEIGTPRSQDTGFGSMTTSGGSIRSRTRSRDGKEVIKTRARSRSLSGRQPLNQTPRSSQEFGSQGHVSFSQDDSCVRTIDFDSDDTTGTYNPNKTVRQYLKNVSIVRFCLENKKYSI